ARPRLLRPLPLVVHGAILCACPPQALRYRSARSDGQGMQVYRAKLATQARVVTAWEAVLYPGVAGLTIGTGFSEFPIPSPSVTTLGVLFMVKSLCRHAVEIMVTPDEITCVTLGGVVRRVPWAHLSGFRPYWEGITLYGQSPDESFWIGIEAPFWIGTDDPEMA